MIMVKMSILISMLMVSAYIGYTRQGVLLSVSFVMCTNQLVLYITAKTLWKFNSLNHCGCTLLIVFTAVPNLHNKCLFFFIKE